ncbi:MAG: hypothetical protein JWP89_6145 [Schlesneria sp.]|nr:hypothetical protein [Schlesneria sp.]
MDFFSRRNKPKPDRYDYKIPLNVRSRFLFTIKGLVDEYTGMGTVLRQIQTLLLREYGELKTAPGQNFGDPIQSHLIGCQDDMFLDFLELVFQVQGNCCGARGVTELNRIFEEENIGYELTAYVVVESPRPANSPRSVFYGPSPQDIHFPQIIRKDDKVLHAGTVEPLLHLLSDPRFSTANSEMIDGLVKLRKGQYQDAIQACGSAVESVLKTIFTLKGWDYDKDKDTLDKLLKIANENEMFFPFYTSVLMGTGTMRNKMSAHGKGPNPEYIPTKEHAEHMVYTCCANSTLLVALAKL